MTASAPIGSLVAARLFSLGMTPQIILPIRKMASQDYDYACE